MISAVTKIKDSKIDKKTFPDISEEDLGLIIMVAERLAPKFTFGFYDLEDIVQEAIILGVDALSRWDKKRPLENFIHIHIRNRLNTLKRDKYYRVDMGKSAGAQETKRSLLNCADIDSSPQPIHELDLYPFQQEMLEKLEEELPAKFRGDYLKITGGGKLSPKRKGDLIYQIKLILGKYYGADTP